ncbi:hypothetical protein [Streptomyces sp. NPDC047014]|uniref:hypothetical protein n=1 Tax=Streptomyces sp. NPDC047014 TaxID=3155736 RepID=UPI003403FC95
MDDQGGAGGVPLHGDDEEARRRAPHPAPGKKDPGGDGTTRAADTDEASRLDRPVGEEGPGGTKTRWKGPGRGGSETPRRQHGRTGDTP